MVGNVVFGVEASWRLRWFRLGSYAVSVIGGGMLGLDCENECEDLYK